METPKIDLGFNELNHLWRQFPHTLAQVASRGKWKPFNYLKYISDKVSWGVSSGGERLIVNLPPRFGKSEFLSFWLPIWFLENYPEKRVIIASHSADLATNFGRKIRNEFESNEFLTTKLRQDSTAANRFDTHKGGGLIAAGVGGPITGRGADVFLIDDPYKNLQQAQSITYRTHLEEWYETVAKTRLEPGGSMILLMTRWHELDLATYLQKKSVFKTIKLPAIAEHGDLIGRQIGESLCPERYPVDILNQIRTEETGSYSWNSLYQQNPIPVEGGLFKRAWWKFYKEAPTFHRIIQSWDCAQKVGITNDYTVCQTWGEAGNGFYLIDLWRQKVEAPQLEQAAQSQFFKFNPNIVLIEDKSSGSSLIQMLRQKTRLPVIAYDPKARDKEVRASATTPTVESGKCFLPSDGIFVEDFITELERFPYGDHDDQVDSFTQMIDFMRTPKRQLRASWL